MLPTIIKVTKVAEAMSAPVGLKLENVVEDMVPWDEKDSDDTLLVGDESVQVCNLR